MPLMVSGHYFGLPRDQREALEQVPQATTNAFAACATRLHEILSDNPQSFGDADYMISKAPNGVLHYEDFSAGYWAVLQCVRTPRRRVFRVYTHHGKRPVSVRLGAYKPGEWGDPCRVWQMLETRHLEGRSSLYINVFKNLGENGEEGAGWYGPTHQIDFQHPLLFSLQNAVDQINQEST